MLINFCFSATTNNMTWATLRLPVGALTTAATIWTRQAHANHSFLFRLLVLADSRECFFRGLRELRIIPRACPSLSPPLSRSLSLSRARSLLDERRNETLCLSLSLSFFLSLALYSCGLFFFSFYISLLIDVLCNNLRSLTSKGPPNDCVSHVTCFPI